MSIRNLAQDLYKAQKKVEKLEKELSELDLSSPKRSQLEKELETARQEKNQLKALLEKTKQG